MQLHDSIQKLNIDHICAQVRRAYLTLEIVVTHTQLAKFTGIPVSFFSMWLSGERKLLKTRRLHQLIVAYPALVKYVRSGNVPPRDGPSPAPRKK